jgi:hypothetical protein
MCIASQTGLNEATLKTKPPMSVIVDKLCRTVGARALKLALQLGASLRQSMNQRVDRGAP